MHFLVTTETTHFADEETAQLGGGSGAGQHRGLCSATGFSLSRGAFQGVGCRNTVDGRPSGSRRGEGWPTLDRGGTDPEALLWSEASGREGRDALVSAHRGCWGL